MHLNLYHLFQMTAIFSYSDYAIKLLLNELALLPAFLFYPKVIL
jgi:hypothetical protein